MRSLLTLVGVFGAIAFAAKLHGLELIALFQPTSLITVYLPGLLYLLINPIKYPYQSGFKRLLNSDLIDEDYYFLSKITSVTLLAGVVSVVFGLIKILGNLADPAGLGSGVAAFTMSFLYAVLPLLFATVLEKKKNIKRDATVLVFAFTLLGGQFFLVLYALSNKS